MDAYVIRTTLDKVRELTKDCSSLEEAARRVTDVIYDEFSKSVVLVRMFAGVPFGELPGPNRASTSAVAEQHGVERLLSDETVVLSLLATRGARPEWNDRRLSRGHVGIPLVSVDFVNELPMIAPLLDEVGLNMDWITGGISDVPIDAMGFLSGLFYVGDARSAADSSGRQVIHEQGFVQANDVRTVFGLAGGYATSKKFFALVVFCRETVNKEQAALFRPAILSFQANTMLLASTGAVFTSQRQVA